jgi:hypothetical protein
VTSSPIFTIRSDPQHAQAEGASTTTRSRGRCSGNGFRRLFGADGIFGRGGFHLLELQLELVDQPGGALGTAAILVSLEHRDLELQACDQRLRCRHHGI